MEFRDGFIKENTKRFRRFVNRRWDIFKYGYSREDLWSLDYTIVRFVLPRLKAFREVSGGFPSSMFYDDPENPTQEELDTIGERYSDEKWNKAGSKWKSIIDHMIWSMEEWLENDGIYWDEKNSCHDKEKEEKVEKGFEYFHKYFHHLWY